MPTKPRLPLKRRLCRQSRVYVAKPWNPKVAADFRRGADAGNPAPRRQNHDQMRGSLDVQRIVRDAHHRPTLIGQLAKELHHLLVAEFIEATGHFVEKHQRGTVGNLVGQTDALQLPATQIANSDSLPWQQAHLAQSLRYDAVQFGRRRVGW